MTSVFLRLGMLDACQDSTCDVSPSTPQRVKFHCVQLTVERNWKSLFSMKLQIIAFYKTTNHCFLWNYKSLFSMKLQIIVFYILKKYTRLYGKSFMFWFLSIRFGPEYFLKMNIIVNISDLRPCSHCYKNVILEFRPLHFASKFPQNAGNSVLDTTKFKRFPWGIPNDPLQMCRHCLIM